MKGIAPAPRAIAIWFAMLSPATGLADWLAHPPATVTDVTQTASSITLSNGLIRRTLRVKPDCATVAFDNLVIGASLIRGVKPEAPLTLDGVETRIGGLTGQPDYAYLRPEWLDSMVADPYAIHRAGFEKTAVEPRFAWRRTRPASDQEWPPKGSGQVFHYRAGRLGACPRNATRRA